MNENRGEEGTGQNGNRSPHEGNESREQVFLKEADKSYRDILDGIKVGCTELDLAGNITFKNNTALKMSSHGPSESIGLNYKDYMSEEMAKEVYRVFHEIYVTGIPKEGFIQEIIQKDGERRIIEGSVSLMRDPQGRPIGFREVWRDITDRIRTEEELANQRRRLEAIFRSVKDGIITVDPELRILQANKSTENICGIDIKQVSGNVFSDCLNGCKKSCHEVLRQTLERRTTIKEYRIECGHQKRNHQLVSVTSSPLLDLENKFMGAVLVIRDITLVTDLERQLRERNQFQSIIGRSKKMQDVYRLLEDLSNLETTVLVTGESGTGKELVARALHYSGNRSFKPFVTVNCSALAENLLESELFGHVKGAFTGAIRDKEGRFQAASGGTILLDEIGDISPLIQLKLLRVLEEKEFERVGESVSRKLDVRVIACTNKDLMEKIKKGEFRQDLYYRLKVVEVALPPLRERLEDLPLLIDHFCGRFNKRFKKHIEGVSDEVLSKLMFYPWPGNVRELEHVMERAFVLCNGQMITLKDLPPEITNHEGIQKSAGKGIRLPGINGAQPILIALNKSGWNKAKAARLLGVGRRTIYRKILQFNLRNES